MLRENKIQKSFFILFALFYIPNLAYAHSFGTVYSLPIPAWLYIYAGGAIILLSFFVISIKISEKLISFFGLLLFLCMCLLEAPLPMPILIIDQIIVLILLFLIGAYIVDEYGEKIYKKSQSFKLNFPNSKIIKITSLILFIFAIFTGFYGVNNAYSNFNMNYFWIYFVLGITYLTAYFGNFFPIVSPFVTLTNKINKHIFNYPKVFGYSPAIVFYFTFIWLELVGHMNPLKLSIALLIYSLLNILGVILIGKNDWFEYCEFFSVFFRQIGQDYFAISTKYFSLLVFIIFMLSSTAFDGFKETAHWSLINLLYFPNINVTLFQTLGLFSFLIIFLTIYLFFTFLSKIITGTEYTTKYLALQFAYSLIPIAIAYNIAHYFTLIITEGPNILRLLSDPLGIGTNIFGTASWKFNFIPSAQYVWYFQIFVILVGHILAVYISHTEALKIFPNKKNAIVSQLPYIILMICFTMIGLWILSAPIS